MTQTDQTQKMIVIVGKLQSVLHDLDDIMDCNPKREMKQRLSNFHVYLENLLNQTTSKFDTQASDAFVEFTKRLDEVGNELKLVISEELNA